MSSPENTTLPTASGGVTSFNTRTGAVTLAEADVLKTFTAKGGILLGTDAGAGTELAIGGTGQVLTVVGGTAAWASSVGSFNIASPTGVQLKEYKFDNGVEGWTPLTVGICSQAVSSLIFSCPTGTDGIANDPLGIISNDVEIWLDYREVIRTFTANVGNAGVAFRVQDANNFYLLQIIHNPTTNNITFTILKKVIGIYTTIATTIITIPTVLLNDLYSNIILVRNIGTVIQVFFNNTLVLFIVDNSFLTSVLPISLYSADAGDIRVDTIRIYSVSISPNRIPI